MEKKELNVVWQPNPGAQELLLECPIFEVLLTGPRACGKTDALLMDFLQFVGKGFGSEWRGIIFRETYKNLEDIKIKSIKWFKQIFPKAVFNSTEYRWTFPQGETLYFRYANKVADYWNYHGHAYPFVGWEELTNWKTLELYIMMFSICRSSHPGIPKMIRSTCNPWGSGHNSVKKRFKIGEVQPCEVIEEKFYSEIHKKDLVQERCYINTQLAENVEFIKNDQTYELNIAQNANPHQRKAWLEGSWDIVAGGMFDDIWNPKVHILPRINIPNTWYIDRSFDYGSSHPFSVGWWAQTDGTPISVIYKIPRLDGSMEERIVQKTFPKNTLIRFWEWYGCKPDEENKGLRLTSKEIGRGIKKIEQNIKRVFNITRINPGPADSSIFDCDHNNDSIAEMVNDGFGNTRQTHIFVKSDKSPGSRKRRWEKMRILFGDALKFPMEDPGLFVTQDCAAFIRTVPTLSRADKDPDDVNCFVAGTKVQTEKGIKNIEDVITNDLVHTPIGLQSVIKSVYSGKSSTIKITFSNGKSLEGTPNHKIYIPTKGLLPLEKVKENDLVDSIEWSNIKSLPNLNNITYLSVSSLHSIMGNNSFSQNKDKARKEIIQLLEFFRAEINIDITSYTKKVLKEIGSKLNTPKIEELKTVKIEKIKERKKVYNLVVEKAGLYYANNILSSNTDEEDHCFSGNTLICTDKGKVPIKDLVNVDGNVLTDAGYQKYRNCRLIGKNKKVIRLTFDNGDIITCTPDHEFFTHLGWVQAQDLKIYTCYEIKAKNKTTNIKLVKMEKAANEDVYCLTVPDYGRFCIESGILVSNCADESGYRILHTPIIQGTLRHRVG